MSFVLNKSGQYSWPVSVSLPIDGGKHEKQNFDITFKRITQTRFKEIIAADTVTDSDLCKEIVLGWKGVVDEEGNEVPFSQSALEALIDIPTVGRSIVSAYLASYAEAARKN